MILFIDEYDCLFDSPRVGTTPIWINKVDIAKMDIRKTGCPNNLYSTPTDGANILESIVRDDDCYTYSAVSKGLIQKGTYYLLVRL